MATTMPAAPTILVGRAGARFATFFAATAGFVSHGQASVEGQEVVVAFAGAAVVTARRLEAFALTTANAIASPSAVQAPALRMDRLIGSLLPVGSGSRVSNEA